MKVLGFVGSPRKDGSTARLVKAILDGAQSKGAHTQCWQLSELKMGGCTSCFSCRKTGRCVLKDDMTAIHDQLFQCDAVVMVSPVYMWQMTGQTKLFVDRLYPVLAPDFTSRLTKKPKLILAFTQGQPDVNMFKAYFDSTAKVLGFLGFSDVQTVVAGGTRAVADLERQADVMARAKAAGRALAV